MTRIKRMRQRGFTLIEMMLAIIIMAVVMIGIGNVISLSGQIYVDVKDRDALLSDARFVIERLNREVREAVPNSVRVLNTGNYSCIEFTPIVTSTMYVDLPVLPDAVSDKVAVAKIFDYQCDDNCADSAVVYPTSPSHVYDASNNRRHGIKVAPNWNTREDITGDGNLDDGYEITLDSNERFTSHSPTERLFIVNSPVSYCVFGQQIKRYTDYGFNRDQVLPANGVLMATNIGNDLNNNADLPFYVDASLTRLGLVNILIRFYRDATTRDEPMIFNLEVNVENVP